MDKLQLILPIVSGCITLLTLILSIIISKTKNTKVKTDCDNILKFLFKIEEFIAKAEECSNWTGNEKKQFVLSMLYNDAKDVGITEDALDGLIEQFVYFTNLVNTKKKGDLENGTKQN